MKGKQKTFTEVSQRTQESSSPAGYELHSFDLHYYAWHFTFLHGKFLSLQEEHFPESRLTFFSSHMYSLIIMWILKKQQLYLSTDYRSYIMQLANIILPRLRLTHATAFISLLRVVVGLFVCLVNLKSASSVQLDRSQPICAKPPLERSGLSPSQCSTKGFTMCSGSERDKGFDTLLLSRAMCETISVKTKQGTWADKTQFECDCLSWLSVSTQDYDTCFVNLESWRELFAAPPQLSTNHRTCSWNLRSGRAAAERIYFVWISQYKCSAFSRSH